MKRQSEGKETYSVFPIGYVRRGRKGNFLEISETFRAGLRQLDNFSHVIVLWWANKHDNEKSRSIMQCHPPYAQDKLTGVFACRAEYRPNPIAMTICAIAGIDEEHGIVNIKKIDAFDNTPILDLKAYFPVCDRVQDARIPEWLAGWPEWMPDEEIGL